MKNRPLLVRIPVLLPLASAVGALSILASCSSSSSAPSFLKRPIFMEKPNHSLVEPRAVVPSDFLFSFHKPYNEWMDTPNRIYYHKVPLNEVFQNRPFTKLEYTIGEMPPEMPMVSYDSLGITRRQLLWILAHDYQLKMSLITDDAGQPTQVIIRWRDTSDDKVRLRGTIDPVRQQPPTRRLEEYKEEIGYRGTRTD